MSRTSTRFFIGILVVLVIAILYSLSLHTYNLFHIINETLMLLIGFSIFTSSRLSLKFSDNKFIKIAGPGIFISSIIIFIHALAFQGMGLIIDYDIDLSVQLWIIANYILAFSFVFGAIYMRKELNSTLIINGLIGVGAGAVLLAFLGLFPACYIDGTGLTLFKKISEVVIIFIYFASIYIISYKRKIFEDKFAKHIILAICFLIIGEFLFTLYTNVDETIVFLGHIFRLMGFLEIFGIIRVYNIDEPIDKLFENLKQEVIKAHQSESETRKIAKTFEELYQKAPLGYQSLDKNGNLKYINEAYAEMLGYKIDELIGVFFGDLMVESSSRRLPDQFEDFLNSGKVDVIFDMLHKDGHIVKTRFIGRIATDIENEFKQTHCILMDVTQDLKYQKFLIESKEKFSLILNSTDEGIYGVDLEGKCTFVNKSFLKILKYEDEKEFIGKNIHELIHYKYEDGTPFPREQCNIERIALSEKHGVIGETVLWKKDSTNVLVEFSSNPQYKEGRLIGAVITFRDITEKANTLSELNYKSYLADKYLDLAGVMILTLNSKGIITLINEKGCSILGLAEKDIVGKNWFDNFLPKDIVENVKIVFDEVFKETIDLTTKYENIIINANGEERLIEWKNAILYDVSGKITGVLSSGEDITESRMYEQSLIEIGYRDFLTGLNNRRFYEDNLESLDISENLPLTIVMADINGLKLINDAFGHSAGDELLISSAKVIKGRCRESDLIARIGGDEFVIVMPNTNESEAERIVNFINQDAKKITTESIQLSISFGFKTKGKDVEDIHEIYRAAEDLMYREKLLEIPSMRSGAIETILNTLYEKDERSEIHSREVSNLSEKLAEAFGMSRQDIAEVKTAGLLHDIGKIIIPDSILAKDGRLTKEEYDSIKSHPEIGFRILNSTQDMRNISNIVLNHHERWDGKGYPRGIKTYDIPVQSRIIAIADAFDAMTSERTYREIISNEDALKEIVLNAGTQFDPDLVKTFEENFDKIVHK